MALWPDAVPFAADGSDSPELDEILGGPAAALTAVALVIGEDVRASGWGMRAAIALAERWRGTRRVLLADLDFERPTLHEVVGVAGDEGVIDVVDYGISPDRVILPVRDGAFDVMPAGTFTADPGLVLRDEAWGRILVEVAARRATLLAYVPAAADGMEAVVERAGAVLVLAGAEEGRGIVERLPHPYAVLAILTPAGEEAEPIITAAGPESVRLSDEDFERIRLPKDRAGREALIADLRDRQRSARLGAPAPESAGAAKGGGAGALTPRLRGPVRVPSGGGESAREARVESAADDIDLEIITPGERPRRRRRFRRPITWTVSVVLLVSLLAGAWRFLSGRFDWRRWAGVDAPRAAAPATGDTSAAPDGQRAPVSDGVPLPYVVALEAHRDVTIARERVAALRAAEREMPFHIAPLERQGVLYYHVMAGPLADSGGAAALRDSLIARGHKTGRTPTDVRSAPLAFLIGDHDSADDAEEQLDELRVLGVPGYVVLVEFDGDIRHRIYVGGFGSRAEADVVRQVLRAAGVRDSLVTRTGSITP